MLALRNTKLVRSRSELALVDGNSKTYYLSGDEGNRALARQQYGAKPRAYVHRAELADDTMLVIDLDQAPFGMIDEVQQLAHTALDAGLTVALHTYYNADPRLFPLKVKGGLVERTLEDAFAALRNDHWEAA